MKKIIVSIFALSALVITSCASETKAETSTTTETSPTSTLEAVAGTSTEGVTTNANGALTVDAPQGQQVVTKPGENPHANLKGNNPEHGQPGHRCDINVGEPLNTPPRAMPTQQAPAVQQVAPAPAAAPANMNQGGAMPQMPAQTTAPGFKGKPNPAHGQPGHRCDVKEGEILP